METLLRQLRARGAYITMNWLEACINQLPPSSATTATQRLEAVWQRYLRLSLNDTSEKALPTNALHTHRVVLKACILEVAAVDEIGYAHTRLLDAIAGPILPGGVQQATTTADETDEESDEALHGLDTATAAGIDAADSSTRRLPRGTLKLTLTDGYEVIFGLEKKFVSALDLRMPPGSKLWIAETEIRRGVIYLKPEAIRVLRCGRNAASLSAMSNIALDANQRELIAMEELELRLQRELDHISSTTARSS
ncbi:hypothetical protein BDF19DRAFT_433348 [Syncephalis fuscata]|nr:hypothetical protein BDF19DRAFT_433348 [Syncephalis fuscata]